MAFCISTKQVKTLSAAMASDQAKRLLSKAPRKWAPTVVGLGIIPLIIHPIDDAVTWAMDLSVRRWLQTGGPSSNH